MSKKPSKNALRTLQAKIADSFEADFDFLKELDDLPFHQKREAAEEAAKIAITKLYTY